MRSGESVQGRTSAIRPNFLQGRRLTPPRQGKAGDGAAFGFPGGEESRKGAKAQRKVWTGNCQPNEVLCKTRNLRGGTRRIAAVAFRHLRLRAFARGFHQPQSRFQELREVGAPQADHPDPDQQHPGLQKHGERG